MTDGKINCPACGDEIKSIEDGCPRCGDIAEHMRDEMFLPGPRGPVNDFAFLLNEEQYNELTDKLEKQFDDTKIPVIVATMYSPGDVDISDYAALLYNWWGIGKKKVNKGVLVLLCIGCRRVESEVGLGLEKFIGEEETDEALSKIAGPFLKDGKYDEGVNAAVDRLIEMIHEKVPGYWNKFHLE
jgi:uncharacterized protein